MILGDNGALNLLAFNPEPEPDWRDTPPLPARDFASESEANVRVWQDAPTHYMMGQVDTGEFLSIQGGYDYKALRFTTPLWEDFFQIRADVNPETGEKEITIWLRTKRDQS